MSFFRLDRAAQLFTSIDLATGSLWVGAAAFVAALIILLRTRWGEKRPLLKCLVLSLLAHLLLASYVSTLQIITFLPSLGQRGTGTIRVSLEDDIIEPSERVAGSGKLPSAPHQAWQEYLHETLAATLVQPQTNGPAPLQPPDTAEPKRLATTPAMPLPQASSLVALSSDQPPPEPKLVSPAARVARSVQPKGPETIEAPSAQQREAAQVSAPEVQPTGPLVTAGEGPSLSAKMAGTGPATSLPLPADPLLPRMTDVPTAADTNSPLETPSPLLPRLTRTAAAEKVQQRSEGFAGATESSSIVSDVGRLSAPSIGSLAGKYREDKADATLSPAETAGGVATTLASIGGGASLGPPQLPSGRAAASADRPLPEEYKLRLAPNRAVLAQRQGASPQTEEAVRAALKWLADNQADDGHWAAKQHGAGRETFALGRDRQAAGGDADSGVTGLALLAFLASGHTPREGTYRENVARGLNYLLKTQGHDGNLSGQASTFARMYCHAMATFALSEAYGMTNDPRLRQPLQRAIGYTLASQNPSTGGWRYAPGDSGDTSQLGWQWMSLRSAELAGIPVPEKTRQGVIKYLRSVSSGRHGGLAAYRPGEPATRSMTAEAMVCWQFLGLPREHPAGNETGDYLLEELPGQQKGKPNLYYWYYATLAMYQLQGIYWHSWNDALQQAVVASQRKTGPAAGSWDADTVWGGYGGRVYTTAIATLSLEVYYRYLPLYAQAAPKDDRAW